MKNGVSKKLVWLCLAIALPWVLASTVSAQPGEFVNGKLQPLADGFPNRALTLVVCDEAGTSDGIYARSLQEALRPIVTVPVMVSDEPMAVGGTFHKLKDIQGRAGGKDGYYSVVMPVWGPSTDILVDSAIEKELGMDLSDLNMVIVTDVLARAFIQRKNPPWGPTFAGMVKWGKANPGKLRYISLEVGSGFDILCTWVMQQTGITAEKIPQGTHVQVIATLGSGEGDFGMTNADIAQSNWQAGRLDITMIMGRKVVPPWDKDPNVVSSVQAGLPDLPLGKPTGLCVPKQVPKAHIDWLFKAFKAAALSDVHKKREKVIPGCVIDIRDPAQSNADVKGVRDLTEPIVRSLKMHWDQQ